MPQPINGHYEHYYQSAVGSISGQLGDSITLASFQKEVKSRWAGGSDTLTQDQFDAMAKDLGWDPESLAARLELPYPPDRPYQTDEVGEQLFNDLNVHDDGSEDSVLNFDDLGQWKQRDDASGYHSGDGHNDVLGFIVEHNRAAGRGNTVEENEFLALIDEFIEEYEWVDPIDDPYQVASALGLRGEEAEWFVATFFDGKGNPKPEFTPTALFNQFAGGEDYISAKEPDSTEVDFYSLFTGDSSNRSDYRDARTLFNDPDNQRKFITVTTSGGQSSAQIGPDGAVVTIDEDLPPGTYWVDENGFIYQLEDGDRYKGEGDRWHLVDPHDGYARVPDKTFGIDFSTAGGPAIGRGTGAGVVYWYAGDDETLDGSEFVEAFSGESLSALGNVGFVNLFNFIAGNDGVMTQEDIDRAVEKKWITVDDKNQISVTQGALVVAKHGKGKSFLTEKDFMPAFYANSTIFEDEGQKSVLFELIDTDNDGRISPQELHEAVDQDIIQFGPDGNILYDGSGLTPTQKTRIDNFRDIDSYEDFIALFPGQDDPGSIPFTETQAERFIRDYLKKEEPLYPLTKEDRRHLEERYGLIVDHPDGTISLTPLGQMFATYDTDGVPGLSEEEALAAGLSQEYINELYTKYYGMTADTTEQEKNEYQPFQLLLMKYELREGRLEIGLSGNAGQWDREIYSITASAPEPESGPWRFAHGPYTVGPGGEVTINGTTVATNLPPGNYMYDTHRNVIYKRPSKQDLTHGPIIEYLDPETGASLGWYQGYPPQNLETGASKKWEWYGDYPPKKMTTAQVKMYQALLEDGATETEKTVFRYMIKFGATGDPLRLPRSEYKGPMGERDPGRFFYDHLYPDGIPMGALVDMIDSGAIKLHENGSIEVLKPLKLDDDWKEAYIPESIAGSKKGFYKQDSDWGRDYLVDSHVEDNRHRKEFRLRDFRRDHASYRPKPQSHYY